MADDPQSRHVAPAPRHSRCSGPDPAVPGTTDRPTEPARRTPAVPARRKRGQAVPDLTGGPRSAATDPGGPRRPTGWRAVCVTTRRPERSPHRRRTHTSRPCGDTPVVARETIRPRRSILRRRSAHPAPTRGHSPARHHHRSQSRTHRIHHNGRGQTRPTRQRRRHPRHRPRPDPTAAAPAHTLNIEHFDTQAGHPTLQSNNYPACVDNSKSPLDHWSAGKDSNPEPAVTESSDPNLVAACRKLALSCTDTPVL